MTETETIIQDTRNWLERAVIGLNLCPFAKAVYVKEQVHYAVSTAQDDDALLADLQVELERLAESDPAKLDTSLLIVPNHLADFLDFNDFLAHADALLVALELDEDYQIADFHPRYQFGGTNPDEMGNFTNRSPYPTLHLLREESIDRAVAAFPHAEAIFEVNMQTLEQLGVQGWAALQVGPSTGAAVVASSTDEISKKQT